MKAVFKREFSAYFKSAMGYIIIAFTLIVIGLFVSLMNLRAGYANFEYALESCAFLFILLAPMITMRVLVEEKRQKTDVLLYTAPITTTDIVVGKYLATLAVYLIPVAISCTYPLMLLAFGSVTLKTAYLGVFGFVLLGAALLSVGLFISSLTDSYIVAGVCTLAVTLAMYLLESFSSTVENTASFAMIGFIVVIVLLVLLIQIMTKNAMLSVGVGSALIITLLFLYFFNQGVVVTAFFAVLNWLSVYAKFKNFIYGIFDITAVVYYISVIFFFGFLTVQSVEKRRWS